MRRTLLALLFLIGLVVPLSRPATAAPLIGEWPTTTPEEQGIDSAKLADALLSMQQEMPNLHSFLLIRDGKIIVDAAFYPYDGSTPHDLASVTKSVTTTLIGIAADQGKLRLDQPVLSFFPDRTIANRDDRKERMTVADLASMTSGLDCVWQPDEPTLHTMMTSDDMVQFTLDLPMVAEPGTTWEYCSPGMHLLSAILTKATGQTELDFAWDNLFGPLEMRDVIWPADTQGFNHGWGDLKLHPRDVAKLGQLWLNGGVWNGRQIVSGDWVKSAVSAKATTTVAETDYGYGWWINGDPTAGGQFSARGRGGQYVVVIPAFDAVVVTTASDNYGAGDATNFLTPALVDPTKALPANSTGMAKLTDTLTQLRSAPDPTPVPALSDTARAISGTLFAFEPNPLGIETFRLDFDESAEAALTVTFAGEGVPATRTIGLDGIFRLAVGDYGLPLGLRGTWEDAQTFRVDYDTIANNSAILLRLRFAGNTVVIEASERTHEGTMQFEGHAVEA